MRQALAGRTRSRPDGPVALWELVRLFRRERPDIVHTHNPKSGVLGRVAARMARVPVVVNTVQGLYANPALPRVRRTLISAAERGAFRVSDLELFQSREDFEWAVGRRLVPRSRATWLGNGVDPGRFDPAAVDVEAVAVVRKGWGAEDGRVVVGAVGRVVAEKGYPECSPPRDRTAPGTRRRCSWSSDPMSRRSPTAWTGRWWNGPGRTAWCSTARAATCRPRTRRSTCSSSRRTARASLDP